MFKNFMKKSFAVLVATSMLFGMTACGGTAKDQDASASTKDAASGDETQMPEVINVGTMNLVNCELVGRAEKYYEEILGVPVNILTFDSGKDVNLAFASGDIDIAELGSSPSAMGIANNLGYEVFWIHDIIGQAESLVAKNDSGISTVADLKGKKIATPFASTAHYSLLSALSEAGLSETDVTLYDMQPADIYAAWERGDIDAAYVWEPTITSLLKDGTRITDSTKMAEAGYVTADLGVVNKEFAEKYPDIVTKYTEAMIKANNVYFTDQATAEKDVASMLEISEEEAKNQMAGFLYLSPEDQLTQKYLGTSEQVGDLAQSLKSTADFLVEQKSIESAPDLDVYQQSINVTFMEQAVKNLNQGN